MNFAVMNCIGAFLVLIGIGMVYARTGGLNMAWAGARLAAGRLRPPFWLHLLLLSIGFLVKGAIVPFHFWLPDAHAVAPTPASLLFSGIMVELGLYAVARIYWIVFHGAVACPLLRNLLLAIGLATAILGACMAFHPAALETAARLFHRQPCRGHAGGVRPLHPQIPCRNAALCRRSRPHQGCTLHLRRNQSCIVAGPWMRNCCGERGRR